MPEADDLMRKTRRLALGVIRLVDQLPRSRVGDVIGRQLAKAGTSPGANYRAACRARSPAEFTAKMGIVEEEADETLYWHELLVEAEIARAEDTADLVNEAQQIVAMSVAS